MNHPAPLSSGLLSFCGLPLPASSIMGLAAANWSESYKSLLFWRKSGRPEDAVMLSMAEQRTREAAALVVVAAKAAELDVPEPRGRARCYAVGNLLCRARSARRTAGLRDTGRIVRWTASGEAVWEVIKLGGAK